MTKGLFVIHFITNKPFSVVIYSIFISDMKLNYLIIKLTLDKSNVISTLL